tara:strand:+ start:115 stop:948 length:834 start_codon:yes stop_codon:yes gene_type:complete
METKTCNTCNLTLDISEFGKEDDCNGSDRCEYTTDDIDEELNEIPTDSIYTTSLIFARTRGIEWGLCFVTTVTVLQILSIFILALTAKPSSNEMQFEHRNWAVITALFLFVIACFTEFFDQNLLNIGVLFNMRSCYVVGRFSSTWLDFDCLNSKFNKNAVKFDMNKYYVFCIVFVVIEELVWLSVLVVGGRLLVQSTSLQDVILNALAAVFVLEMDDLMGRMMLSIGGKWKENKYYALKKVNLRPFPSIGRLTLYFFWLVPIVPGAIVAILYFIPYW